MVTKVSGRCGIVGRPMIPTQVTLVRKQENSGGGRHLGCGRRR